MRPARLDVRGFDFQSVVGFDLGKRNGAALAAGLCFAAGAVAASVLPTILLTALVLAACGWAALGRSAASSPSPVPSGAGKGRPVAQLPTPEQALALIRSRRSVFPKDYSGRAVPGALIQQLLEAATWAPTHCKQEPWRFVVLDQAGMQEMQDVTVAFYRRTLPPDQAVAEIESIEHDRRHRWSRASHMIAICMLRQARPDKRRMPLWEEQCAVAAAVQNVHLLLHAHGMAPGGGTAASCRGACGYWSSWHAEPRDSPEMGAFLGLGAEDKCLGFFVLGVADPDRTASYRAQRTPASEKTEWRCCPSQAPGGAAAA